MFYKVKTGRPFVTVDLAVVDSEGYVNIVDRKKDMIISGGENIYSIEVENVLYIHPKILEEADNMLLITAYYHRFSHNSPN